MRPERPQPRTQAGPARRTAYQLLTGRSQPARRNEHADASSGAAFAVPPNGKAFMNRARAAASAGCPSISPSKRAIAPSSVRTVANRGTPRPRRARGRADSGPTARRGCTTTRRRRSRSRRPAPARARGRAEHAAVGHVPADRAPPRRRKRRRASRALGLAASAATPRRARSGARSARSSREARPIEGLASRHAFQVGSIRGALARALARVVVGLEAVDGDAGLRVAGERSPRRTGRGRGAAAGATGARRCRRAARSRRARIGRRVVQNQLTTKSGASARTRARSAGRRDVGLARAGARRSARRRGGAPTSFAARARRARARARRARGERAERQPEEHDPEGGARDRHGGRA